MCTSDRVSVTTAELNAFIHALGSQIEYLLAKGDAYRWGNDEVEPDAEMAAEYYREAAEMGDWEAMELLADLLEEMGHGDEAAQWRQRRAVAMGEEGKA